MSGTSLDGADAALVDFWQEAGRTRHALKGFVTLPFPPDLRAEVDAAIVAAGLAAGQARTGDAGLPGAMLLDGTLDKIPLLDVQLGEFFAEAAQAVCAQAAVSPEVVDLIGSHGQTLWHVPGKATLQLGEPAIIAERTGITTIADFRPADIAAGGQGAPLVPYADCELYSEPGAAIVLLNLGGIANLTLVDRRSGPAAPLLAFDTGPGNTLLDGLCRELLHEPFDHEGRHAARGTVHEGLLTEWLANPYFASPPPKSTGREEFGPPMLAGMLARIHGLGLSPEDALATATDLTARPIVQAIQSLPVVPAGIRVSGGGVHNTFLMTRLGELLGGIPVVPLLEGDAKEAIAFAFLAYRASFGLENSDPGATGSQRPLVMGKIVPGRNFGRVLIRSAPPSGPVGQATTEWPHPAS
ncbi:MAG: anhydro-N-acetylmuramic acid kinase, partial [Cyanobacteria bacterium REEB65]|nr:anhydro-N-acetylmuramic acid kinase [Cyanobacteria bacterium REEB65]